MATRRLRQNHRRGDALLLTTGFWFTMPDAPHGGQPRHTEGADSRRYPPRSGTDASERSTAGSIFGSRISSGFVEMADSALRLISKLGRETCDIENVMQCILGLDE